MVFFNGRVVSDRLTTTLERHDLIVRKERKHNLLSVRAPNSDIELFVWISQERMPDGHQAKPGWRWKRCSVAADAARAILKFYGISLDFYLRKLLIRLNTRPYASFYHRDHGRIAVMMPDLRDQVITSQ